VGVLSFIEQLPQGFFTHLNENGANLSGGQRQRLAIARALYRDAPILLLDEPTSALDAKSERQFFSLLAKLRSAGRTIVLAAHNSAALALADLVVTIEGGKISGFVAREDSQRSLPESRSVPSMELAEAVA
jgi:ATP-binding cassette subfamily B protein